MNIIRLAWLAIGVCGVALPASAADPLTATSPFPDPGVAVTGQAPSRAWDGIYAGLFAAHDLTSLHIAEQGAFSVNGIGGESELGGFLVGLNHRFADRIVGGFEVDAAFAAGGAHFNISDGVDYLNSSITGEWGVSAKGRIGYLVSPDTLFYLSGGAVMAKASYGCSSSLFECPPRTEETLYGWPVVGIGAETYFADDWRFRMEYEGKFLPTLSFDTEGVPFEVTPFSGTAKVALIRDFGKYGGGPAMAYPDFGYAPATWTGLYGGAAGGYTMSVTAIESSFDSVTGSFDGLGGRGPTGGFFGGYRHQIGSFVLGAEAGYYWNGGRMHYGIDGLGAFEITGNSFYSFRGHAGVVVNPSTMIYALGGWIHADGAFDIVDGSGAVLERERFSREGMEVGGGIEAWVNSHLSIRAEYVYAMFGDEIGGVPSDVAQLRSRTGTATIGAVFHLGH